MTLPNSIGKGPKGDIGAAGIDGSPGAVGAKGDTGTTGSAGAAGMAGAQGIQGVKGDTGAAGSMGSVGATGGQGIQGSPGAKGDTGATGTTGTAGAQGAQGADGAVGAAGSTGPAGVVLLGKVDLATDQTATGSSTTLVTLNVAIPTGGARILATASYGVNAPFALTPVVQLVVDGAVRDQNPGLLLALNATLPGGLTATVFLGAGSRTISLVWSGASMRCRASTVSATERASITVLQIATT